VNGVLISREALNKYRPRCVCLEHAEGMIVGARPELTRRVGSFNCAPTSCHQRGAVEAWHASGRFIDYVGDWHTHPEPSPTPSGVDLDQWCLLREQTSIDPMLELIFGTEEMWVGLVVKGETRRLVPAT
jgi:integrative and conjugative element protein (TIGR02256 family)